MPAEYVTLGFVCFIQWAKCEKCGRQTVVSQCGDNLRSVDASAAYRLHWISFWAEKSKRIEMQIRSGGITEREHSLWLSLLH